MKTEMIATSLLLCLGVSTALPSYYLGKREVPQEHSHQQFLTTVTTTLQKNNPAGIVDPVFGLLGNGAAAAGLGKITDVECLQQATADQAFTNAKAAKDVTGMTAALIYRALERNTGKVGLASNSCTSITAVNPEIAAVKQHQDPASTGAAATNKAIVLELAKQIASVGGNAQDALKSGTFKPGSLSDNTGKGNTCDVASDTEGCIFSQNLLVEDATAAEITAAVGGAAAGGKATAGSGAGAGNGDDAGDEGDEQECEADTEDEEPPATTTTTAEEAEPTECEADDGSNDEEESTNTTPAAAAATTTAAASAGGVYPYSNSTATPTSPTGAPASTGSSSSSSKLSFGSCSNPTIVFGNGFDGRTGGSFEPANKATFTHGSALDAGIIAQFICDRLNDTCKAGAATVAACRKGQAAVQGRKDAAAAGVFNAALGL